jgi:transcriptional regulator with XRE-family HTH domain
MEETIVDRILKLFEVKHISNNEIVERIDISRPTLSQWKNGGRNTGLDNVMKLKTHWKNLNLNWLLLGQGTMFEQIDDFQTPNLFSNIPENSYKSTAYEPKTEPIFITEIPQKTQTAELPKPEAIADKPPQIIEKEVNKHIEKIIVFYNNGTFEER